MNTSMEQLAATILRATTLALRFGLMFYLALVMSPGDVGLFSLYTAALQLSASLIPLDIYSHTTRLLLSKDANAASLVQLHFGSLIIFLLILTPFALASFYFAHPAISLTLILFFLFHTPMEVIATDAGRLLIPLHKPLLSNLLTFIRTSLWVIPMVVIFYFDILKPDVTNAISLWLGGSALSLLLSHTSFRALLHKPILPMISLKWIKTALTGSLMFLAGSILFRVIMGGDKFIINNMLGIHAVAIYSLFGSVALGVLSLVETGISSWHFPKLISQIDKGNLREARVLLNVFFKKNLLATIVLMTSIGATFPLAVKWLLSPEYFNHINVFFIISSAVIIYCISMPFHYIIYGFKRDDVLLGIYLTTLIAIAVWCYFFLKPLGLPGGAWMFFIALSTIALGRMAAAFHLLRSHS